VNVSSNGLHMIEQYEGYRAEQYLDGAGVPTIGFGTTASVVDPLPKTCTEPEAQGWLELDVERSVEPALNAAIAVIPKDKKTPNQNQYDALVDAGYNLGEGIFGEDHTLGAALRAGNLPAVSAAFLLYDKDIHGVAEPGLVTRRKAEQTLFNTPVPIVKKIATAVKKVVSAVKPKKPAATKPTGTVKFSGTVDLDTGKYTIERVSGGTFAGPAKKWEAALGIQVGAKGGQMTLVGVPL
jgi:lysozyme